MYSNNKQNFMSAYLQLVHDQGVDAVVGGIFIRGRQGEAKGTPSLGYDAAAHIAGQHNQAVLEGHSASCAVCQLPIFHHLWHVIACEPVTLAQGSVYKSCIIASTCRTAKATSCYSSQSQCHKQQCPCNLFFTQQEKAHCELATLTTDLRQHRCWLTLLVQKCATGNC